MTDWWDHDFYSDDPLTRFNAHQASKGNRQLPDPDTVRKAAKENGVWANPPEDDEAEPRG